MTRTPRRAMLITPTRTYLDDDAETVTATPTHAFAHGLPGLLDRVQATFHGEGVLLLDGRTAVTLGLPIHPDDLPSDDPRTTAPAAGGSQAADDDQAEGAAGKPDVHPVLAAARTAGWRCSALRAWTTYHTPDDDPRATVHVGILPLLELAAQADRSVYPLLCSQWPDTLAAHRRWHELTGSAYHGTPGVAGMAVLRETADAGPGLDKNDRRKRPTWQPQAPMVTIGDTRHGLPRTDAAELPYLLDHWGRTEPGARVRVGYDARLMYLSAAGVVPLSPRALRNTGKLSYRSDLAGWWLVDIAPWQLGAELPDPAGYSPVDGPRWVTGPTLALLDELVAAGIHGGYEVADSWTCGTTTARTGRYAGQERGTARTVLKPWAERIRDSLYAEELTGVEALARAGFAYDDTGRSDLIATWTALKECYSRTIGMLNAPGTLVRRPDWHYAIIAQARTNLFRAMRKAATKTPENPNPRYPLGIDTDLVWYSADTTDRQELKDNPPHGFRVYTGAPGAPKLGGFTVKKIEERRRRRGH